MFLIPRRQIWAQQPQGAVEIDWTHPLAKGLDFAWTPGNPGLDVASKRPLTISGATRSVSAQGVGLGFSGGLGALRFASNADLAWTQNPTIIWVAATAATVNRTILGSRTTPGGLLSAFVITMPDYSLRLEGQNYSSSGFSYQAASTPGTVDGKMHCFAVAKRGNSYHQFYRDGAALSTTTLTSGPVYRQDNAVFEVGGINTGIASYDHNEPFGCFLIFRDPISDADIKALTLNPWQIFKRPDSRIFVPVSVGGGPTNITGILLSTLDSITTSIQGRLGHVSTFSVSLDTISITGSGNLTHIGTSVNVLDGLIVVFNGAVAIAGSVSGALACTLDNIVFNGVGNLKHSTTINFNLDDIFVSLSGTVAGTPENIDGTVSIILDGIGFIFSGNSGTITLTEDDINAIMNAIINNPKTLTVPKFLGLK